MANTKKFAVKNGLTTPNVGFLSPDETKTITATMLNSGMLSFTGTTGQLFSVTDSMTGTIFAVNDISGIPSIEVDDTGTVRFAELTGNVLIGTAIDDATNKLQVNGSIKSTNFVVSGGSLNVSALTASKTIFTDASKNLTTAGTVEISQGGTGATTNTVARTNLGATTVGANLFTLTNPSAITFPRFNADNTVSSLDAATFRTAIGAQASGSYLTAEADTLATVTGRGATSTGSIATPVGEGNGYAFWNDTTNYKIHMGVTAGTYQYGPVTDYSMRFTMGGGTSRGFTWGYTGSAPIAALNASTGNMQIAGTFSALSKSFLIDHPTKPGKQLRYGSLESPYYGVRLTGESVLINGIATVKLPDYIHGLCKQQGAQVQITNIKHGKVIWVDDINVNNDEFTVKCDIELSDEKEYKFYWSFTAIRKDIAKLVVEE